ncbi:hypothetical protein ACN42_g9379 [Penicillium freii]|uniref:Uncharacterized protein n=1 Tax=Penicillium freii TaxID=48697 RepID=A0A117NLJ1_PENFR|nr:hypothetical protein ACN42_g9379 [Penicillium freii]
MCRATKRYNYRNFPLRHTIPLGTKIGPSTPLIGPKLAQSARANNNPPLPLPSLFLPPSINTKHLYLSCPLSIFSPLSAFV